MSDKKNLKTLTIAIATFNSADRLPLIKKTLDKQTLNRDQFQIIIIDGGSTDQTKQIAQKYHWLIIDNPQAEPVNAKFIAYKSTATKYLMFLDHDEVFVDNNALESIIDTFEKNNDVKAVMTTGYQNPSRFSSLNRYVSEFGDPFSYFIYHFSKDAQFCLPILKKRYPLIKENNNEAIFDFYHCKKSLPIIELVAGGGTINVDYFKNNFPQTLTNKKYLTHFFYLMNQDKKLLGINKHSIILHYSAENIKKYLPKLKWRIKNNIFHQKDMGEAGFSGRNNFGRSWWQKNKKYLFIPYSLLIVPALIDSIYLAVKRHDIFYLSHALLSFYTILLILYYYLLKIVGKHEKLTAYNGQKITR